MPLGLYGVSSKKERIEPKSLFELPGMRVWRGCRVCHDYHGKAGVWD